MDATKGLVEWAGGVAHPNTSYQAMPNNHSAKCRRHIPKLKFKVKNWREYDGGQPCYFVRFVRRGVASSGNAHNTLLLISPLPKNVHSYITTISGSVKAISFVFIASTADTSERPYSTYPLHPSPVVDS